MADDGPNDWVIPQEKATPPIAADDWVVPSEPLARGAQAANQFVQGSLYDPKNPTLSDDPRYWPPVKPEKWKPWWQRIWEAGPFSSAPQGRERATFLPLEKDEQGKGSLAVPGIAYDPLQASQDILKTYQAGVPSEREHLDVGAQGLAAGSVVAPDAGIGSRVLPAPATVGRFSTTVQGAAEKRAARALLENAQTVDPDATPPEILSGATSQIQRGQAQGQDMRVVDVGGESTRNELRRSRDLSDRSGQQAKDVFDPRSESQSSRMIEWLRKRLGNPEEASVEIEQIKENARDPKSTAYKAAYTKGESNPNFGTQLKTKAGRPRTKDGKPVLDLEPGGIKPPADIVEMMQDETMKDFAKEAEKNYNTFRTAKLTHQPHEIHPFTDDGQFHPAGLPLEFWDRLVRVMSDDIQGTREKQPAHAMGITELRKKIVGMLDAQIPEYKAARGIAAEAFGAVDAVEAGQALANSRKLPGEIAAVRRKVDVKEWGRVQVGFWTEYLRKLSFTGESRNIVKYLANNPGERQKIAAVLGTDLGSELEGLMYIEDLMETSKNTVLHGSQTSQKQQRARSPSILPSTIVGGLALAATHNPYTLLVSAFMYGLQQVEARFRVRVAERTAELLLSNDPRQVAAGFKSAKQFLPNMREAIRAMPALGSEDAERQQNRVEPTPLPGIEVRPPGIMRLGGPKPDDSEAEPSISPRAMRALEGARLPTIPMAAGSPDIQSIAKRWLGSMLGPLGVGQKILGGESVESLTPEDAGELLKVPGPGMVRGALTPGVEGSAELGVFGSRPPPKPPRPRINLLPLSKRGKMVLPTSEAQEKARKSQREMVKKLERANQPRGPGATGVGVAADRPTPEAVTQFWKVYDRNGGDALKTAEDLNIRDAQVTARLREPSWARAGSNMQQPIPSVRLRAGSRSLAALQQLRRIGFMETAIYKTLANEFGAQEAQRVMQANPRKPGP